MALTVHIVLIDPKYPHNVGGVVRAASCYGADSVWIVGNRVQRELDLLGRLPREERLRKYVPWSFVDKIEQAIVGVPVAVELLNTTENLPLFEHPADVTYVFGPEDGNVPKGVLSVCHRFVSIPSYHCLNLAAAVYTVLYDRVVKRWANHQEPLPRHGMGK
jgi:tRNA C32,U32 (ribose-2'-O)-methylase TrmJ